LIEIVKRSSDLKWLRNWTVILNTIASLDGARKMINGHRIKPLQVGWWRRMPFEVEPGHFDVFGAICNKKYNSAAGIRSTSE
jgi:hypothetical protein